jgi:hypothetical protein
VIARPTHILAGALFILVLGVITLASLTGIKEDRLAGQTKIIDVVVAGLGLTDLCISTEARYTRHPAVSDPVVPFMDYPGSYEHFPTGSFWAPIIYFE